MRIHTGDAAAQRADALGARAFTEGTNIGFATGAYQPGTPGGDMVLAHELAHVVQQRGAPGAGGNGGGSAHEADADRAAVDAIAWQQIGAPRALAATGGLRPQLASDRALQRWGASTTMPPDTSFSDALVKQLRTLILAGDRPGFFGALACLDKSRAGDPALRAGISQFLSTGNITAVDAFRAVCFQELGPEVTWERAVHNFLEGLDRGTYSVTTLPPTGEPDLRAFCIARAAEVAAGTGDLQARYRGQFSSRWVASAYVGLSREFDPDLDSHGPRNPRARQIFDDLYNDAGDTSIRDGYQHDTPHGFRQFCDTFEGPDGDTLLASPRIQALRAAFSGSSISAAVTTNHTYQALVATVTPLAAALDNADRVLVSVSHQWRDVIERKLHGSSAAVIENMRSVILGTAPAPAAAPATTPVTGCPAPTPTKAQQEFLSHITVSTLHGPINARSVAPELTFAIDSDRPNPGLAVHRRVEVTPAAQVWSGVSDERPWPDGVAAVNHKAKVDPNTAAAGGVTTFTASVTLPPLGHSAFSPRTATIDVVDHRRDEFRAKFGPGLSDTNFHPIAAGGLVEYFGGQLLLHVAPELDGGKLRNSRVEAHIEGVLTRNGAPVAQYALRGFGLEDSSTSLGDTIVEESHPPRTTNDAMELVIKVWADAGRTTPLMPDVHHAFEAAPGAPADISRDRALMVADNAFLAQPASTAGSLLAFMTDPSATPVMRKVAALCAPAGTQPPRIKVLATMVRSDSARWLRGTPTSRRRGDPAIEQAYAMGVLDDAHTRAAGPGAAGWRMGDFPHTVFLNVTPDPAVPTTKRPLAELASALVHETIHDMDPDANSSESWDRYRTEFRAYWLEGRFDNLPTDTVFSEIGPHSPRANAIFRQMYDSALYDYVRRDYDKNTRGFRTKVDTYVHPDGLNLSPSRELEDLRQEIERFTGSGYAAKRVAIRDKFVAASADDRREIAGNRDWRDLVERKFHGNTTDASGATIPQADDIKSLLGIPLS